MARSFQKREGAQDEADTSGFVVSATATATALAAAHFPCDSGACASNSAVPASTATALRFSVYGKQEEDQTKLGKKGKVVKRKKRKTDRTAIKEKAEGRAGTRGFVISVCRRHLLFRVPCGKFA